MKKVTVLLIIVFVVLAALLVAWLAMSQPPTPVVLEARRNDRIRAHKQSQPITVALGSLTGVWFYPSAKARQCY